mmetsp:Transcript_108984/g.172160  ORF Transcript_108984/g.172160 Transcript_108984/m.172160 type:complete len:216 (+) Transcript_108984:80-727(+)
MVEVSEDFKELAKKKQALEAELKSLEEYLNETGLGLKGPLIDEEGFPRADIDIYAIRKARNRFACAQTDHVEVMKKIEAALFSLHSESRVAVPREKVATLAPAEEDVDMVEATPPQLPSPPFALIDEVSNDSPAQEAGLAIGDLVLRFGHVCRQDTGDLNACFAAIQELVPRSIDSPIEVQVLRGAPPAKVLLTLRPRRWQGRGLLGCHMAPKTD